MPDSHTPLAAATLIVRLLHEHGHVAYFAGGCVRDTLLGLTPKDYDVATDARPEQVAAIFRYTQFIGEAFGVTLVRVKRQAVEVATFRREWDYQDGRHPSHVAFTDAEHDAQRRDFTINGLFQNPLATRPEETIIDYVGGRDDLAKGVVRAIGQPADRFAEDYLRMLRAVRFAARYGFAIEPQTEKAIKDHADRLGRISRERIGQEIATMLTPPTPGSNPGSSPGSSPAPGSIPGSGPGSSLGSGPHSFGNTLPACAAAPRGMTAAAALLQSLRLDAPALQEENLPVALTTLTTLQTQASPATDYATALAAWMLDRHAPPPEAPSETPPESPESTTECNDRQALRRMLQTRSSDILARWRKALMLSNVVQDAIGGAMTLIDRAMDWPDLPVAQRKRLLAHPHWPRTYALLQAMAHRPAIASLTAWLGRDIPPILAQGDPAPARLITGEDLIALGQKPGPMFGRLLEQVYDQQLEGRLTSHRQALTWIKNRLASPPPSAR